MSVNLEKNKESLMKAWKDVVDDKTKTDWAVFSYEPQTFNLKVEETGSRGLTEMADSLNSGMIMYAFCRVLDPKTSLPKYVLINWQGDGAPVDKKGKCANHIRDVANLIKGAHITFNARNEDEVDPDDILDKVSRATVSHFSFSQRDGPLQSHQPVGSVYKRTLAAAEINPSERDKFWEQEEIAEKQRVAEEKRKADEGKKRLEEERKDREIKEAKFREDQLKEKTKRLSLQSEAEKTDPSKSQEKVKWEKQLEEDKAAEDVRKNRSEMLREERRNEAQTLIAQRTFNARAVFEQNTWKSQMSSNASSPRTPNVIDPAPDERSNRFDFNNHAETAVNNSKPINNGEQMQQPQQQEATNAVETNNIKTETNHHQNGAEAHIPEKILESTNGYEIDDYSAALTAQGLRARALYDYQAADDTELSFDPDDIITNIDQVDEGWWQGMAPDGTYGLFPANYVELLDD